MCPFPILPHTDSPNLLTSSADSRLVFEDKRHKPAHTNECANKDASVCKAYAPQTAATNVPIAPPTGVTYRLTQRTDSQRRL
jgi:hypothetical protein